MSRRIRPGRVNPYARRQSRYALVQAIYQWQIAGTQTQALAGEFHESSTLETADQVFFDEVLSVTIDRSEGLDAAFASLLDREPNALDQVERAILRLGACELRYRPDVPWQVVINEYVEQAKIFGATDSYKYINGVLHRLAGQLRTAEPDSEAPGSEAPGSEAPGSEAPA